MNENLVKQWEEDGIQYGRQAYLYWEVLVECSDYQEWVPVQNFFHFLMLRLNSETCRRKVLVESVELTDHLIEDGIAII